MVNGIQIVMTFAPATGRSAAGDEGTNRRLTPPPRRTYRLLAFSARCAMNLTGFRQRLRWTACRSLAWGFFLSVLASSVVWAFRCIERGARASLVEWRNTRRSPDGELLAIIHTPLPPLHLAPGSIVEQSLCATRDGLCGLRLEIQRAGDASSSSVDAPLASGQVIWRLVSLDVPVGEKRRLATGTLALAAAATTGWCDIRFPPLPDSAGTRYMLKLLVPTDLRGPPPGLAMYTSPEAQPTLVIIGTGSETPRTTFPIGTAIHLQLVYASRLERRP